MARLVTCGFEMNTVTTGIEFTATSGSPTISSTTVRSGTYAGRISSLASATQMRFRLQYVSSAGNGPYFARLYLRVHTAPSAANRIITMRDTGNGADRCWITLDNSSTLALFNGGGSQIGSSSSALTADTKPRRPETGFLTILQSMTAPAHSKKLILVREKSLPSDRTRRVTLTALLPRLAGRPEAAITIQE